MPGPAATTPIWQRFTRPAGRGEAPVPAAVPPAPASAPVEAVPFSLFHKAGFFSLLIFVPIVFSRINEFLRIPNLVFSTVSVCLATSILTGAAYRAATSRPGKLLLLFTVCIVASVPFSVWRGGSYEVLAKDWVISLLVFFAIAGSVHTFEQCRKAMYAMALGGMLILLLSVRFGSSAAGRFAFMWGTLGNPNDFATYLIMGLPFCLFVFLNDTRLPLRAVAALSGLGILVYGLRSGSRGGMVALVGLVFVLFLKLSLADKFKLLAAGALVFPVVLALVPRDTLQRLVTFGISSEEDREDNRQVGLATSSYNARRRLMQDAIKVTLQNPVVGVGAGQFQVAATRLAEDRGIVAMWRETHNGYLQVSSECGIPALLIYLGLFAYCFRTLTELRKAAAPHPALATISKMAMCLFMATAIFAVVSLFGSYGYTMLLPVLCAFTYVLQTTAEPVIRAALASSPPAPNVPSGPLPPRARPLMPRLPLMRF
ncbi:MAG: O-antigen ligase family protein [Bryobacteraceae bacterium]|nr:O-antigen ligase family protein [Bryobacteraceae bacterium]